MPTETNRPATPPAAESTRSATNGVNGRGRNAHEGALLAVLARSDPRTPARMAEAEALIRKGEKNGDIMTALRAKYGFATSPNTLRKIRVRVEREEKRKARRATKQDAATLPAPVTSVSLVEQLVAARIPFRFDGVSVTVEVSR